MRSSRLVRGLNGRGGQRECHLRSQRCLTSFAPMQKPPRQSASAIRRNRPVSLLRISMQKPVVFGMEQWDDPRPRARPDPFAGLWDAQIRPMLEAQPGLWPGPVALAVSSGSAKQRDGWFHCVPALRRRAHTPSTLRAVRPRSTKLQAACADDPNQSAV